MATGWETYPIQFEGGLVTNLAPLQLGIQKPGAARVLENFEPSVEGGYRRILGYTKYTDNIIPSFGGTLVQGGSQTGTSLDVANLSSAPEINDVFTIAGVTGSYTITSVSYNSSLRTATLGITPALASSPADQAVITFTTVSTQLPVTCLAYFRSRAVAYRGGSLWEAAAGGAWSRVSIPNIGSPLVQGAAQTGTTLNIDGATALPSVGDAFTIDGVALVYTVTAATAGSPGPGPGGGNVVLTISPALDSSPANNAIITFIGSGRTAETRQRFTRYSFNNTPTLMFVGSGSTPVRYSVNGYEPLSEAPSDVVGAEFVAEFKSSIFYGKDNTLTFTVPFTDDNFSTGDGAGVIGLPHNITGLIVFRDQLIVFCRSKIYRVVGNSFADFQLLPISLDIGCIESDSVQEVGGDVAFLGPDGVRLLGATERIGDFNFGIVSRGIQKEVTDFIAASNTICSTVIRGKNQYRLFSYNADTPKSLTRSILGTQFADQTNQTGAFAWAEIVGMRVYSVDSQYTSQEEREVVIFAGSDGYIYNMESSNSFDGAGITAKFFTPYLPINDPRVRKTIYKVTTYLDPTGSIEGQLGVRYDFNNPGKIQPEVRTLQNTVSGSAVWGTAVWGSFTYSDLIKTFFDNQTTGSGFTVSLEYTFDGDFPPFSLDSTMIEYSTNDRR